MSTWKITALLVLCLVRSFASAYVLCLIASAVKLQEHGICLIECFLHLTFGWYDDIGSKECQLQLDWPTRHRICVGIARGLAYLHEESRLKIVHRDIKATNVLLDKDLNPKISDFGLAKLDEEDNTHISTRIAGTL